MKNYIRYTLAIFTATLAFSAASQAQSNPPAWSPTTTYKVGDVVTYEGVEFKCLNNEALLHPTPHSTYWDIAFVYSGPLVIPVGPSEAMTTLTAAWNYIAYASIATNSSIEIKLDTDYTETFTSSFSLDHPYGSQISISGANYDDPNVTAGQIYFTGGGAGFTLDSHHAFGDLDSFTINAPSKGSGNQPGIAVTDKACLGNISLVTIQNFDVGISANTGAILDNCNAIIKGFAVGAIYAGPNATIYVVPVSGFFSNTTPKASYGIYAQGGTIFAPDIQVSDCKYDFYATDGGKLDIPEAQISGGTGCFASGHSYINAAGGILYPTRLNGCDYGFIALDSSYINATKADVSNPGTSAICNYYARRGGIIDATNYEGTTLQSTGVNDGSFIYGLP